MTDEIQICQLIAKKIAGVASETDLQELARITNNDDEIERALNVVTGLWNNHLLHQKKEMDQAFRIISSRLEERKTKERKAKRKRSAGRWLLAGSEWW